MVDVNYTIPIEKYMYPILQMRVSKGSNQETLYGQQHFLPYYPHWEIETLIFQSGYQ